MFVSGVFPLCRAEFRHLLAPSTRCWTSRRGCYSFADAFDPFWRRYALSFYFASTGDDPRDFSVQWDRDAPIPHRSGYRFSVYLALDDVVVAARSSSLPEPDTMAMLFAGLGAMVVGSAADAGPSPQHRRRASHRSRSTRSASAGVAPLGLSSARPGAVGHLYCILPVAHPADHDGRAARRSVEGFRE
jgi:hypothetical protein